MLTDLCAVAFSKAAGLRGTPQGSGSSDGQQERAAISVINLLSYTEQPCDWFPESTAMEQPVTVSSELSPKPTWDEISVLPNLTSEQAQLVHWQAGTRERHKQ